jgi:thiol-disulfide isomerase/thioredoxin/uncharacterized membrane protein YphA (DoxX/SURF4 family)
MIAVLPIVRLLLAGVFAVAGVAKLRDPAGTRQALADFRVPAAWTAALAVVLPLLELAIAAALLPRTTAVPAALAAMGLLLSFSAAMAALLARGRRPDCRCFGQLRAGPIGWPTLARNAVLFAAAALVVTAGPDSDPGLVEWLAPLTVLERSIVVGGALGLALLATQTMLLARLVRAGARERLPSPALSSSDLPAPAMPAPMLPATPTPLAIGSRAPAFSAANLDGGVTTLDMLLALGTPAVLLFSDPACGPCDDLLPRIAQWEREQAASLTVAVISRGTPDANRAKARDLGLRRLLLQQDWEIAEAYRVMGTPGAVVVQPDGTIGSLPVQGDGAVAQLLTKLTLPPPLPESAVPSAPPIALPDLDGRMVALADFLGRPTLVLFWNPGCGFCEQMLPDLRRWEAKPPDSRPQLFVVSIGGVDENRRMELQAPIVLDPDFAVMRQYGATGTPSARLVDTDGRFASDLLVGGTAILAHLGKTGTPSDAAAVDDMPAADTRPVKQDCVHDELLADGSMVLYNGCRQEVLTLNGTGALVWECCDGEHDFDAIVAEVQEVFPSADAVDRDVRGLLGRLFAAGMIAPGAGAGAAPEPSGLVVS